MSKKQNANKIIFLGIIVPTLILVMIFMSLSMNANANTHTIKNKKILETYSYEKINPDDINKYYKYYTRLDINKVIYELGVKEFIPFFNQYTNNNNISLNIIKKSIENDVPINIAFSLAWKESRFNCKSINRSNNNGTSDWGLFQLNDQYYKWCKEDFFNIEKNIQAGIIHLKECLRIMNDIDKGLAAYNAGVHGVKTYGIPQSTQKYIIEILEYEDKLNQEFNAYIQERDNYGFK